MGEMEKMFRLPNNMEHTFKPLTPEERAKFDAESYNAGIGTMDANEYDCKICLNKGMIMKACQENGVWTTRNSICVCQKTRNTIRRMKKSGLKNLEDSSFSKYQTTEAWQAKLKDAALKYAAEPSGWFFIGGQTGAGKTHLCTAICSEFINRGKEVKYMLWRDDAVKLKSAVIHEPETYTSMMDDFKRTEVLYIDDLFKTGKGPNGEKQQPTGADVNIAFEILNYRYNDTNLLTIISSECTVNDIIDIDEATGGRIFERAVSFSLKPDKNKNYRLKGVMEL